MKKSILSIATIVILGSSALQAATANVVTIGDLKEVVSELIDISLDTKARLGELEKNHLLLQEKPYVTESQARGFEGDLAKIGRKVAQLEKENKSLKLEVSEHLAMIDALKKKSPDVVKEPVIVPQETAVDRKIKQFMQRDREAENTKNFVSEK